MYQIHTMRTAFRVEVGAIAEKNQKRNWMESKNCEKVNKRKIGDEIPMKCYLKYTVNWTIVYAMDLI